MAATISNLTSTLARLSVSRSAGCTSTLLHRTAAAPTRRSLTPVLSTVSVLSSRSFSATPGAAKGAPAKGGAPKASKRRRKVKGDKPDPRIRNLKISNPRKVPAPLRFARNRHLRHWTIHRAWLLWQRKEREGEERELMRMYQSMASACEELRTTSGPGTRDEGYLYRVAMEKKGLFGHNAVPIEYARPQTETPARIPWNHDWTR
ncbi:hypothetical protein JX266_007176 [Neoarthrinium moseri]|nr:hypothetical protein JX266_007176 [Neoarthrinium moseri]